jgi:uncharacterized protein (AIM24 family)
MILDATDIPAAAAYSLLLVLVGAWVNHRLSLARENKKPVPISREESDILIAAAQSGRIIVMSTDAYGEWIRADETDFVKFEDPAVAAKHMEAFYALVGRGLVLPEGGAYKLSGTGFNAGRRLSGK